MTGQAQPETLAELVSRVRSSQAAKKRAEAALAARHRALCVSVARALAGGANATDLAKILGLTRQRVYQLKDEATEPGASSASSEASDEEDTS